MIITSLEDTKHKAWMFRLLAAFYDDVYLSSVLFFKGGTCAAMRDFLDRFSVDLDFDYLGTREELPLVRQKMEKIFDELHLEIKDKSQNAPQYFLKYLARPRERNTIKIDVSFPVPAANQYESVRLPEIDRIVRCQTIETMFANKMLALIGRYEKTGNIAGRDLYDVHHFFMEKYRYDVKVIEEMRGCGVKDFLVLLIDFVEQKINQNVIDQDLNTLLPLQSFQILRKTIKQETLMFLRDELERI